MFVVAEPMENVSNFVRKAPRIGSVAGLIDDVELYRALFQWMGFMKRHRYLIFLLLAGCLGLSAQCAPAFADKRVALVIGNSKYSNTPALENPVNDATDVSQALSSIGFKVTLKLDASKRDMDQAIAQFARDATSADAAMFYYAGHGMQFQGQNYVMPVDAELKDEISLRYEMTAMDDVKAALQRSPGVKIMVLDSCRNNPLAAKLVRSISANTRDVPNVQGYARPEKTRGMIIVYATQADDVARDGSGRNSPFSAAFLKEVKEPGLEIGTMFRRIGGDVYQATDGLQSPELSISLVPEYYLNQTETDQVIWARIRTGADAETIRQFLDRYPSSFYAPDAKARLELLEGAERERAQKQNVQISQEAAATNAARLKAEQAEKERIAKEAQLQEQALTDKLAAAEAERQKLASELALRETEQASRQQAATASEKAVQETADRTLQAAADRAAALKAEIAQLELQAAQAKADAATEAQKAAEAKKAASAADTKVALAAPGVSATSALTPEQMALVVPIQLELVRVGCYGAVGDWASTDMQRTVAKYARYAKLVAPPDAPSDALLNSLKQQRERVCPSECSPREVEAGGRCVAKSCGANEYLAKNGACIQRPPIAPRVATVREPAPKPKAPSAGAGHCFNFNGNQYCE